MYSKTFFSIDGINFVKSSKGIPQGSTLSPLLFDLYIDSLIKRLESDNTLVRAYADDLVLILNHKEGIDAKLKIIIEWSKEFSININPKKSGIMRLLKRRGKVLGVPNMLNIEEVQEYKYLGIWLDQSLSFSRQISYIKSHSAAIWKGISC
jgi:hypothetical protein